ncbi:hypothetical protein DQ04_02191030 [Trypanosoma grayi]|uniref:hypothetical protein n=1 Tax=Trypanosoma grayi TaxID=71804 RepID=UPI0004F4A4C3|nr:hypothetical protein DQ04_02191030 [Trypanosoma grayi]KEG11871.1 hypothetical protein DQ04_02191030 [Trypanosoma grayi]
MTADFFESVFSFSELPYPQTQARLLELAHFESGLRGRERCWLAVPGVPVKELDAGWFYTPSVNELRQELSLVLQELEERCPECLPQLRSRFSRYMPLSLQHVVGDSVSLHQQYPDAVFQAASQFNLLEFPSPHFVPEMGVAHCVHDKTQGPACAVSCAVGLAYRCYLMGSRFVCGNSTGNESGEDSRGQTKERQANMMRDVTRCITNGEPYGLPSVAADTYYTIRNGYFSSTDKQMTALMQRIDALAKQRGMSTSDFMNELSGLVRIGVVEDTMVTLPLHTPGACAGAGAPLHTVTQTYNSALSLSPNQSEVSWAAFATMVLAGSYEATLLSGALHVLRSVERHKSMSAMLSDIPPIFLTKVGGGVFHNHSSWIRRAIDVSLQSLEQYQVPLNLKLVHFRGIEEAYV